MSAAHKARAFFVAATLAGSPAYADQADEIARLREQAATLRQSLDQLEAKIQSLEGGTAVTPARNAPSPPQERKEPSLVSLQRSWSEVQPGVSQERVDALLGKPERVMRINGDLVWYYVYPGYGRGSVFFNGQEKVTAVQAPRIGWF